CEQLNAWLGGFESILSKMTVGNFNWFLHTILFLHSERVIQRQIEKQNGGLIGSQNNDEEEEEEEALVEDEDEGYDG
ncbi:hypothetical protein BD410DRAFT_709462, partial [Rickenella mellea]